MEIFKQKILWIKLISIISVFQFYIFSPEFVYAQKHIDEPPFEQYEQRITEALSNNDIEELSLLLGSGPLQSSSAKSTGNELFGNVFGIAGLNGRVNTITDFQETFCIGGDFTSFNSDVLLGRVACFNEADGAWEPIGKLDDEVRALQVYDGNLYAGGNFRSSDDTELNYIARWNGSEWKSVGTGFDFHVSSLTLHNGKLIAGGLFQNSIAAWNGESWEYVGGSFTNDSGEESFIVSDLLSENDTLYVSGELLRFFEANLDIVAYRNESENTWINLGSPFDNSGGTRTLTLFKDQLVAASGSLPDSASTGVKKWNSSSEEWQPMGSNLKEGIWDLHVNNGDLYAGTSVFSPSSKVFNGLARWDEVTESWIRAVPTGVNVRYINTVMTIGDELVVGGQFSNVSDTTHNMFRNIAWIEDTSMFTKEELDLSNTNGLAYDASTVGLGMDTYVFENNIIVGGRFDYAGDVKANNIALWDGSNWEAMGEGLDGSIRSMVTFEGQLHAANLQGTAPGQVSKWHSSTEEWIPVGEPLAGISEAGDPLSGGIWRMVVYNDSLYAAGGFNKEKGAIADLIVRWNPGNETWEEVGEGLQGGFRARGLTVYNGELYAGGAFNSSGDTMLNNVARWDEETRSWQPVGDGLDGNVNVLTVLDGDLHAAGIGFKISTWVDSTQTWVLRNQGIAEDSNVYGLDEYNGEFFAGTDGGDTFLYRWDKNLKEWKGLANGPNNITYRMTGLNGKLHLPGFFTQAGGLPAIGFTTLDVDMLTSTEEEITAELVDKVNLLQNYPNPFNPSTQISYTLPKSAVVSLEVFNVIGQRVATLFSGRQNSGKHSIIFNASKLSSGIYFYRLKAGNSVQTKKMLLIK